MKRTLAALAIATLTGVSAVAVAPAFAKPDAATEATTKGGDRGEMKRGPHGGKHAGKHEGHHGKRGHGAHGPRNMQMWLASNLSAAETLIGVTADQQDAWRGYTNAVLAMFERPARPDVKPGDKADAAKVPFAREERLIRNATDRAAKAADLSKAIEALKAKLTPEQLQKLADAELRFGPPMRGHGHGPDRGPGHGPRGKAPQAGPDRADAPEMPDDAAPQAE
jgi:hypothetical protein